MLNEKASDLAGAGANIFTFCGSKLFETRLHVNPNLFHAIVMPPATLRLSGGSFGHVTQGAAWSTFRVSELRDTCRKDQSEAVAGAHC
jgi:hypothetical protein